MKSEWSGQIEKLIRKYRLRSIFFQNLRQLFRLLLIPLLIMSVLIYTAYHYIEEKEMKSAYGDALSSLEEDIESTFLCGTKSMTQKLISKKWNLLFRKQKLVFTKTYLMLLVELLLKLQEFYLLRCSIKLSCYIQQNSNLTIFNCTCCFHVCRKLILIYT